MAGGKFQDETQQKRKAAEKKIYMEMTEFLRSVLKRGWKIINHRDSKRWIE